ncbi:RNA polymerase I-specific transcription initiation factor rrn7 [Golovinomyces cichoracearum]|uniref:RNA polymerase I-specific transcription initiation factor rrn7 n=1 Tax=Golovinomyces cichoracearum TaxID=62708 RepID=A0A420ICE5_9PEZI|nr:RNA polymerase I-specific transcription initiation factor rrn7 [Golovinomyces cichoracearum]
MSSQSIEYFRFSRNESCTEEGCRAQKFYIEDGRKFCRFGHEQAGFTQTQQDEDDFNSQGVTSRKRGPVREHTTATLNGSMAKELYLQCLQLILWKQCHWLTTVKGLSAEFQVIVRDLWTLRVGKVLYEKRRKFHFQTETDRAPFSSQSEVDSIGHPRIRALKKEKKSNLLLPKLLETLSLCYLGMLLMRLPIGVGEVLGWVTRNEILYLRAVSFENRLNNVRKIIVFPKLKALPKYMRSKLPAQFHSALELKVPLNGPALYGKIQELIFFFHNHYHMSFPPLNLPLLAYKYILNLGLPIEVYPAIERLKDVLSLEFKFQAPSSSTNGHRISYPEIQLIGLIVIATKLSQPHDDITREPESELHPTLIKIDWEKWVNTMANRRLDREAEISLKETDIWTMNDRRLDLYLDWFQQNMLDDRDSKVSENLLNLFPLQNVVNQRLDDSDLEMPTSRLKTIQEGLVLQKVWPPGDDVSVHVRRPGELYKRYRNLTELNFYAEMFYTLAASTAGIPLKMFMGVVSQLEIQLDTWVAAERNKRLALEEKTQK